MKNMLTLTGLVASERGYGESDRFISIITEENGVIDVSVKGARNITGKNNASTQLFSYSKFCFNERGGRRYLDSSEPIHVFYGLRLDVKKLALACYIAEAAARSLTPSNRADRAGFERDIMRLILNSLYLLENGKRSPDFIKAVFELRFASDTGHIPRLLGCDRCCEYESDGMYFTVGGGLLHCAEHFDGVYRRGRHFKLSAGMLRAVRHICLSEPQKVFNFKLSDDSQKELSALAEAYILSHLSHGHVFKTLEYYNNLKE
jgi:DNA repair protein RecO (recombination protein O)